jgi:hypothetical protein
LGCILRGNDFIKRPYYLPGISVAAIHGALRCALDASLLPSALQTWHKFEHLLCLLYSWRKGHSLTIYPRSVLEQRQSQRHRLPPVSVCQELYLKVCATYHYWTTWNGTIACPELLDLPLMVEPIPRFVFPTTTTTTTTKKKRKSRDVDPLMTITDFDQSFLEPSAPQKKLKVRNRGARTLLIMDDLNIQAVRWNTRKRSKRRAEDIEAENPTLTRPSRATSLHDSLLL